MGWIAPTSSTSLADSPRCENFPEAALVPVYLRECYRQQGRDERSGINWAEILAGASIGLVVTVIAHKIIKVT